MLSQAGLKKEMFHKLVTTSVYRMPANSKHPVAGWKILHNTNKLVLASRSIRLKSLQSYDGVKTGYNQPGRLIVWSVPEQLMMTVC